jgi:Na+/H+ antiporter NhaD/arsenite permease-like protein
MAAATSITFVATLSGNPQNILIGSFSGIGYLDFLRALLPIAVAGMAIQIILLWRLYPEVRSIWQHRLFPIQSKNRLLLFKTQALIFLFMC